MDVVVHCDWSAARLIWTKPKKLLNNPHFACLKTTLLGSPQLLCVSPTCQFCGKRMHHCTLTRSFLGRFACAGTVYIVAHSELLHVWCV